LRPYNTHRPEGGRVRASRAELERWIRERRRGVGKA
jgi:hypothetical protein